MVDAGKETFELVMLDEYLVLFTNARIDRKIVPEDLFCYAGTAFSMHKAFK